jgi:lysyl-tRNA synthetase class 2
MKRILAAGVPKIYQIAHAFRADELGPLHCSEFLILEWYRTGTDYLGIMEETEELLQAIIEGLNIDYCRLTFPLPRMSVDDLYYQAAGWMPSVAWDEDRYFRDWVEKVETVLRLKNGLFLVDFPVALASLSRSKDGQPQICERFELFLQGIETANAFTELTDYDEHLRRFKDASRRREQMGKEVYPIDEAFMESVRLGIPECAGIALGLDRLIMALLGHSSIENIQAIPPLGH